MNTSTPTTRPPPYFSPIPMHKQNQSEITTDKNLIQRVSGGRDPHSNDPFGITHTTQEKFDEKNSIPLSKEHITYRMKWSIGIFFTICIVFVFIQFMLVIITGDPYLKDSVRYSFVRDEHDIPGIFVPNTLPFTSVYLVGIKRQFELTAIDISSTICDNTTIDNCIYSLIYIPLETEYNMTLYRDPELICTVPSSSELINISYKLSTVDNSSEIVYDFRLFGYTIALEKGHVQLTIYNAPEDYIIDIQTDIDNVPICFLYVGASLNYFI